MRIYRDRVAGCPPGLPNAEDGHSPAQGLITRTLAVRYQNSRTQLCELISSLTAHPDEEEDMEIHYQKLVDVISQYLQLITVLSIPLLVGIGGLFHFYFTEKNAGFNHLLWCLILPAIFIVIPLGLVLYVYGEMIFSLAGGSVVPVMKSWAWFFAIVPLPCFLISIIWAFIGFMFLRKKYAS